MSGIALACALIILPDCTTRAVSAMPEKKSTRYSIKSGCLGRMAASSRSIVASSEPTNGVQTNGSLSGFRVFPLRINGLVTSWSTP
ncbi:MAG: hypothetical protein IPK63_19830 [Candidatus Competibacteraceae bacterium]|nr:hypothetical protein [Candidatus Competibacteraceae bacterium]